MDNNSRKPTENRFLAVLRIAKERRAQQAAGLKPLSIDWLPRQELPRYKTSAHIISERGSEQK